MKLNRILLTVSALSSLCLSAENVPVATANLVGDGIVEFVPQGFDKSKTPSLILQAEPEAKGAMPADWQLIPQITLNNGKASATLPLTGEISLYGGGEVTGPLLRNGRAIKL